LTLNANLEFAKPYQRLVWQGDRLAVIRREFESMEEVLGP
jgi:hypothetical protein